MTQKTSGLDETGETESIEQARKKEQRKAVEQTRMSQRGILLQSLSIHCIDSETEFLKNGKIWRIITQAVRDMPSNDELDGKSIEVAAYTRTVAHIINDHLVARMNGQLNEHFKPAFTYGAELRKSTQ